MEENTSVETNTQNTATEPKPIGTIIEEGRAEGSAPDATQPEAQAGQRPERAPEWSYAAYKKERASRQALSARVRELEDENRAILAANQAAERPQQSGGDFWADPEAHIRQIRNETKMATSEARWRSKIGTDAYDKLDEFIGKNANHPDIPILADTMQAAADPVAVAVQWAQSVGWQEKPPQRPAPVFPSNLATARNVGTRQPAWSGPQSIGDILTNVRAEPRNIFKR